MSLQKESSFTSHMCRKHRERSPESIDNVYRVTCPQPSDVIAIADDTENTEGAMPAESAASDMRMIVSLIFETCVFFYLKLQGQLFIHASTIQTIVEEMQNVYKLGQQYTITKVSSLLLAENLRLSLIHI